MNRWIITPLRTAIFLMLVSFANGVYAQDQQPPTTQEENGKPRPAAHAIIFDTNDNQDATTDPNALKPDTSPLTGVQAPSLGTPQFRHSYWVPGIQVADTVQSNGGSGGGWSDTVFAAGNLSLLEAWSRSNFALNYSGGGYFSPNGNGNGSYQQVGLVQAFNWQRWQLVFLDDFSYLPTSQFGFGGLSNIGTPGVGGSLSPGVPTIGGPYLPDQNVFIANGPRYSNSFAAEATFEVSRRSSFTFVGSYGFLRFVDAGNIDNSDVIGSIGYNHELSKKDTIGVLYRFTAYHFTGFNQAIGDHVVNIAYGRKITGRLGLSLFAGPEVTYFRVPVGTSQRLVKASFGGSIAYGFKSGGITLGYDHGTNGGGGVLAGAYGDNVNATANRQVTRLWSARGNFGYGRIHGFTNNLLTTNTALAPIYNSYYLGAGLDRALGRNALLSFGYTAYIESINTAACGKLCAGNGNYTTHQLAVGFQWHTRPFVLR